MNNDALPKKQGLYDPQYEHDNCGVGFVVDIKGKKSNAIVKDGLTILKRLSHRGAVGADPKTGDGAGIMIQIPHEFYAQLGYALPPSGAYGTGLVFLPNEKEKAKKIFEEIIEEEGQHLVGWRDVPTDDSVIGVSAKKSQPSICQIFIGKGKKVRNQDDLERMLYLIRRKVEIAAESLGIDIYIVTLSSKTVCYKGLLTPEQVDEYFLDLKDPLIKSAIALVHSRYSTNTFPTWSLAQPFRFLAHNGEINTLRGNMNWMKARGITLPGGSDSAALDNAFELLVLSGRSIPHAIMMLVPQAWEHDRQINKKLKDFYQYHACFMEPWDGPAALAFTDGKVVAAALDRNGLRPARYIITNDGKVIMASEVGVLETDPASIISSGRLEPGKIFYVDTEKGEIISDQKIKEEIAEQRPYGEWVAKNIIDLEKLPKASSSRESSVEIKTLLKVFGYSREYLKVVLKPMAEKGKEPIGSMGNDTPHAVLSVNPQPLYDYFRQLFAQVTNPPIDPIREEIVMSLKSYVGPQRNILEETSEHCQRIRVKRPILTNSDLEKIKNIRKTNYGSATISTLFPVGEKNGFNNAIDRICREAAKSIKDGASLIILSDRGIDKKHAPLPALAAIGAVHHYLIANDLRMLAALIVESGEPREVHHFALLFAYGADCVNPYLAYQAIEYLVEQKDIVLDAKTGEENFRRAAEHGILKILSKMGISTLRSYRGAQIFEALGLSDEVIDKCFAGTASRIGGADFLVLEKEALLQHKHAYPETVYKENILETGGLYQWKKDGEKHLWNPDTIACLQDAVRREDYSKYKEFAGLINDQSNSPVTLRSLMRIKNGNPIPIEEVEPAEKILKRFATGAMSFGSISRGAHETMAIAMNRLGGKSNTGEGGEDPIRFSGNRRSAIKQVASGRFGVNTNYLVNADEIQIKMAQGAKPGEGGQLPGHKVSAIIAKTRYTTPGVTLISPPPHHDIYSIEDLAQLIFDLKNVNPAARISVKLVSEVGVGTVAAGVAKGHADMILISGGDGGTGASPLSSIRYAGLPWELGLSETHQTLVLNDLRSRVRLQTDGQLRTGRDIAIAAMLGAEEYGLATAALIVMGCVMLRHCHLNNCSLGVATQDEFLSNRFSGRPEYLVTYLNYIVQELREIMASLGIRSIDALIGRSDLLEMNKEIVPWKAKNLNFEKIFFRPKGVQTHCTEKQDHGIENVLDRKLIEQAEPALKDGEQVRLRMQIENFNRTAGAMLSGAVCKKYGEAGLPEDTIWVDLEGIAGQSFGAWLAKGISLNLKGMANDYVGKGISGGKIIISPAAKSKYLPEENIIIGNTTFYGAIAGEAYIHGVAGERFCIRNSGLYAVVEGVGDHGCEYMTGGRVIVLGKTGRNFAAGMSGGIAYVYDRYAEFEANCNLEMVAIEKNNKSDEELIREMLSKHYKYTGSLKAKQVLDNFAKEKRRFVKVMPIEYKRVLSERLMKEEELEKMGVSDG
ncbi:MAG: glutamate synthase large subunit [Candidatus Margulisiibacteriota bacterium]